jgi:hypothetical protein
MPNRTTKFKRLAVLNRKIIRLGSELETLQFMQDRLERDLRPGGRRSREASLRRPRETPARGRRG